MSVWVNTLIQVSFAYVYENTFNIGMIIALTFDRASIDLTCTKCYKMFT